MTPERGKYGDGFKLKSGRYFYANRGIVGLGAVDLNGTLLEITDGYDGTVAAQHEVGGPFVFGDGSEFSSDEVREICDYQIALWQKLRDTQR